MSELNRRQYLKKLLGQLVQTAGTVVLASAAASAASAQAQPTQEPPKDKPPQDQGGDIRDRADKLPRPPEGETEADQFQVAFINTYWRNYGWGNGWRNGGWRNGGWGNGWGNGGWRNGGWRNGWGNGGWRY